MKKIVLCFLFVLFFNVSCVESECVFSLNCENVKSLRQIQIFANEVGRLSSGVVEGNFGFIELTDSGFKEFKKKLNNCEEKYFVIEANGIVIRKFPGDFKEAGDGSIMIFGETKDEVRSSLRNVCPLMPIQEVENVR